MSLISAPRQTKTGFNGGDADTQGSNSTSSEVPERKAGGLKRVKSPTKIFKSKKKEESPALRQPSLAINVRADLDQFACDPVGPGTLYLVAIVLTLRCSFNRSMRRMGPCHMTSATLRIRTLQIPYPTCPSLPRSFPPGGDPSGGRSV